MDFAKAARSLQCQQRPVLWTRWFWLYLAERCFQFLKTGIRCHTWVDESTQGRSAKLLDDTDVVIALSHTGQACGVIDAARMAKALGAFVISITNCTTSPLADASDIVLATNVGQTLIGAEAGASRIAQLAILDALTVSVAVLRRRQEQLF